MIKSDWKSEDDLQLNMTPMIDMIFLLIIFFLTATTFAEKEREQEVELPSSQGVGSLSKALDKHLVVNVLKDGQILVDQKRCGAAELKSIVADRNARANKALKVKLRVDRRTPFEHVSAVLDAVEGGGVARPHIDKKAVDFKP